MLLPHMKHSASPLLEPVGQRSTHTKRERTVNAPTVCLSVHIHLHTTDRQSAHLFTFTYTQRTNSLLICSHSPTYNGPTVCSSVHIHLHTTDRQGTVTVSCTVQHLRVSLRPTCRNIPSTMNSRCLTVAVHVGAKCQSYVTTGGLPPISSF
jgi:hypothetical protein